MKPEIVIVPDARDFMNKCCDVAGKFEQDMLSVSIYSALCEYKINSPIEQIFYSAFRVLAQLNFIQLGVPMNGVLVEPQRTIGDYRVDFFISNGDDKNFVVECDGHEFHDRDEKQRRYEKMRDRFLQSNGYRVFHFTGKEIKDNPIESAAEVLCAVLGQEPDEVLSPYYLYE